MAVSLDNVDGYDDFIEFDDIELELNFEENNDPEQPQQLEETEPAAATTQAPTTSAESSRNVRRPRQRRPRVMPRPQSNYTLDKAKSDGLALLQHAATDIATNEFVCDAEFELSTGVKNFADVIVEKTKTLPASLLARFLTILTTLWPIVASADKHSTNSARSHAMLVKFNNIRTNVAFTTQIVEFLKELSECVVIPDIYPQMFLKRLFEKMATNHEEVKAGADSEINVNLTSLQENIVRYTGGYIVSRLPRKISKLNFSGNVNQAIEKMTKGNQQSTRLNYTKEWVSAQTRGGLVIINDATFLLFAEVEKNVRKSIPRDVTGLQDVDLRILITQSALVDRRVLRLWEQVIGVALDEAESLKLLQLTINFYGQVRGFSTAKNIFEKYKIKSKKSRQKSLRTGLKRSQNPTTSS